ncbi:hypothetical protein NUW54_g9234 [Trametes sanguinea]|uniref:Uncharacterized protein n=1 Tax=Trametes sanguinea TaxID=158606 RepID=A0ACC1PA39_9APHY|nr:hypothetical protein NUW54_g9234 [Trametes sanguinea]
MYGDGTTANWHNHRAEHWNICAPIEPVTYVPIQDPRRSQSPASSVGSTHSLTGLLPHMLDGVDSVNNHKKGSGTTASGAHAGIARDHGAGPSVRIASVTGSRARNNTALCAHGDEDRSQWEQVNVYSMHNGFPEENVTRSVVFLYKTWPRRAVRARSTDT